MRLLVSRGIIAGCLLALIFGCFGKALLRNEQFGYRDAAHFYYPLYQRVQQVWSQGRLPVWDARENSGMPLLGNPTAAVLYPVKLVFAVMPYPWAARIYIVLHAVLAVAGMALLMKDWGVDRTGCAIAGFSYGFGAPILFQYCNVIYLVGAAWVPWGLWAADRWIRQGRRGAIVELALILAMQVLGGDPQAAYLVGLCAVGYAVALAISKRIEEKGWRISATKIVVSLLVMITFWFVVALFCAWWLPQFRVTKLPPPPLPWSRWVPRIVLGFWLATAGVMLRIWRRRSRPRVLPRMIGGLMAAALLAGTVSAAQLFPVLEFTQKTERASEDGTHDIYPFSVEIHRVVELAWPGLFGQTSMGNRSWHSLIPPSHRIEFWVPSLYIGGITLVLGLAGMGFRDSRRGWLTCILLVSLLASFGRFGSPLWLARHFELGARLIGPFDAVDTGPIRRDFKLRDGEGGFYWLLATVFPGFGSFRYPSKLLTFVVLGLAGLAGLGWEDLKARLNRKSLKIVGFLLLASVAGLLVVQLGRGTILQFFKSRADKAGTGSFGPFDPLGAWKEARDAFLYGSIFFALGWIALRGMTRQHAYRAANELLLVALVAADLLLLNSRFVYTVPQSFFEDKPLVLQKIEEAEAANPSPGPFRVHRLPSWEPPIWSQSASPDRVRDLVRWERKTIQPKYGLPLGVSYTLAMGVGELYDYDWFFSPFHGNLVDPNGPNALTNKHIYYPRRGFDMWNTRYFIIPSMNRNEETHAISSFLMDTVAVAPRPDQVDGPKNREYHESWMMNEDWRVVRNLAAYPRSWIVHDVEIQQPILGMRGTEERTEVMYKLLYQADPLWTMKTRRVYDPKRMGFVEVDLDEGVELLQSLSRREPDPNEKAIVHLVDDERVEIDASLTSPGLVILADVYYPGWEVTLDGQPTTMYRTNRLMRGVRVPSGSHKLVFRYRSRVVLLGIATSILGAIGLIGTGIWARRKRVAATESV